MKVCPNCGAEYANRTKFCGICGTPMLECQGTKKISEHKKVGLRKLFVIMGGTVSIIAIAMLALCLFVIKENKEEQTPVAFVKGNELYYAGIGEGDPIRLTKTLYDISASKVEENEVSIGVSIFDKVYMSKNNKIIYYPEYINESTGTFTLCKRNLSEKESKGETLDADVSSYMINAEGNVITYLGGTDLTLYQMVGLKKEKIDSDVYQFNVSEDGESILYSTIQGILYLKNKGEDAKEITRTGDIVYIDGNFDKIYFKEKGILYKITKGIEKEIISKDVEGIINIYESEEAYYFKYNKRDLDVYELYYFNGKEEVMLSDQLKMDVFSPEAASEKPVIIYQTKDSIFVANKDKVSTLDQKKGYEFFINSEGSLAYYLEDDSESSNLYKVQLTSEEILKSELYETNVGNDGVLYGEDEFLYYKNIQEGDFGYQGDLYRNKEKLWENTEVCSLSFDYETGKASFYRRAGEFYCNQNHIYDAKEAQIIGENIESYLPTSTDRVVYIGKEDEDDTWGELYTYGSGEKKKLGGEVTKLLYVKYISRRQMGHFFNWSNY